MKKLFALLLCFTFCMAFAGCAQGDIKLAKTIYVGKIKVDLPDEWQEYMSPDQTTFTFKDENGKELGRLVIGMKAVTEPEAVTDFKEVEPTVAGEGFKQAIYIIKGIAQDGSKVTEYHLINQKRDYTFIFSKSVKEKSIRILLDAVEPM